MLNVRLNKEIEEKLKDYSEQLNQSKSSIVKEALAMYFNKEKFNQSPYDLGDDLFGKEGSGIIDASATYKSRLKQKLDAKHSH